VPELSFYLFQDGYYEQRPSNFEETNWEALGLAVASHLSHLFFGKVLYQAPRCAWIHQMQKDREFGRRLLDSYEVEKPTAAEIPSIRPLAYPKKACLVFECRISEHPDLGPEKVYPKDISDIIVRQVLVHQAREKQIL